MPLIIGGAIALILGIIGFVEWRGELFILLKGSIPVLLFMGGILALYVGYDDLQEKIKEEKQRQDEKLEKAREEIEMIRAKAELYKEELDRLKEGRESRN
jgi:uncharacterized membrane protein